MTYKRILMVHALAGFICFLPYFVAAAELKNPLEARSIAELIEGLLRSIVYIALPLISLAIVYSGFKFVIAQGNESELSKAKQNFYFVVLGAILILGAWAISQLIGNTINQLR